MLKKKDIYIYERLNTSLVVEDNHECRLEDLTGFLMEMAKLVLNYTREPAYAFIKLLVCNFS